MYKDKLLRLERGQKRVLQILSDIFLTSLSTTFAIWLQVHGSASWVDYHWLYFAMPLVSIPVFIRMGMYRAVMRYFGNEALLTIVKAVSVSVAVLWLVGNPLQTRWQPLSAQLTLLIWMLNIVSIGGLRLVMRHYFMGDWYIGGSNGILPRQRTKERQPVAIYGAGSAGNQLLLALRMGRDMRPVAFIDDDKGIVDRVIAGLKVYSPQNIDKLIRETGASEILLAIPSVSRSRRREILDYLQPFSLHVRSVPGLMDLASGRVEVSDIQEVDVADLLGRDAVPADDALLHRCITGQAVMVTGAGGSIGSELCRQIISLRPRVLVLFEHSEYALYSIYEELSVIGGRQASGVQVVPVLGSIRRTSRINNALRRWSIDTIYHAAAYKHVPLVEQNIAEGILNNIVGTLNLAQCAIESGVSNFVLVSTDKAVRPTNVMGASKRLAEMILQALSKQTAVPPSRSSGATHINRTRFTMVRFGNVLGSSGSVIPRFREQILAGGPVTVTHPNITRYFMTIPEAAQLVIQAGSMGRGGDVFLLDMGEPVRIVDLARKMILLSGTSVRDESNPDGDIPIEYTGLRPGEKLYEELLIGADSEPTDHPMIMKASEEFLPWDKLQPVINELMARVEEDDYDSVRTLLVSVVQGYVPEKDIVDLVYIPRASS